MPLKTRESVLAAQEMGLSRAKGESVVIKLCDLQLMFGHDPAVLAPFVASEKADDPEFLMTPGRDDVKIVEGKRHERHTYVEVWREKLLDAIVKETANVGLLPARPIEADDEAVATAEEGGNKPL